MRQKLDPRHGAGDRRARPLPAGLYYHSNVYSFYILSFIPVLASIY